MNGDDAISWSGGDRNGETLTTTTTTTKGSWTMWSSWILRKVLIVWHEIKAIVEDCIDRLNWFFHSRKRQLDPLLCSPLLFEEKVDCFTRQLQVPYSEHMESHRRVLAELWELVFPDQPSPSNSMRSPAWKSMGFQSENPATDFRGGGLYSLELLTYFAREHPGEFDRLVHKREGIRSEWEYPFAAASINMTSRLLDALNLRTLAHSQTKTRCSEGFLVLLLRNDNAFEEIYVESMKLLDRVWLEKSATYMDFPVISDIVCNHIKRIVGRRWFDSPSQINTYYRPTTV